jgi:hypothetical protein
VIPLNVSLFEQSAENNIDGNVAIVNTNKNKANFLISLSRAARHLRKDGAGRMKITM